MTSPVRMPDDELTLVTISPAPAGHVHYTIPAAPADVHNPEIIPLLAGHPFAGQDRLA